MKQFNKEKGFSLFELLVSIAVISIITIIVLVNYRAGEKQYALRRSAHKLAHDIRRVQEMSMSAQKCQVCDPVQIPKTGYGIFLDKNYEQGNGYRLYADTSGNNEFFDSLDTIVDTPYLEKGIFIYVINTTGEISINFKPPDPEIKIKFEESTTMDSVEIILCIRETSCLDSKNVKKITVNKFGLVEIE